MTDIIVVGSGAGGAPLAWRLSEAGFHVVVLEKGPNYQRNDYLHDEAFMRSKGDFFVPSIEDDPHILVDHTVETAVPVRSTVGWIASCVGGGTAHMGGALFRFHPDDFCLRTRFGAFELIADWPYSYADLEPYYSLAEWQLGVSGGASKHPFMGFRSRPYPMAPLDSHPLAEWFDAACHKLDLHPIPTPYAINSVPNDGRPSCAYCDFCSGYGCPTGAKGSTQETFLARAVANGRCEIRSRATVTRVLVDWNARAKGCVYRDDDGAEHELRADVVVVACSAVETARLLLLSTSALFPEGLANRNGLVGQHLQFHAGSGGRGRFARAHHSEKSLHNRNPNLVRSLIDYYFVPPAVASFPKGGVFRFDIEQPSPIQFAEAIALRGPRLLWGEELQRRLRHCWLEARNLDFEVFHDFIPNQRTFVELDPDVRDKWGVPVARVHAYEPRHHKAVGQWLVDRGLELVDAMGADEVRPLGVGYRNTMMTAGTCRAGRDSRTSVLDEFCGTHDVPNLFVVDGSFMPTSGGAPCTLSIVANSLRTADYVIDRARSGDFWSPKRGTHRRGVAQP